MIQEIENGSIEERGLTNTPPPKTNKKQQTNNQNKKLFSSMSYDLNNSLIQLPVKLLWLRMHSELNPYKKEKSNCGYKGVFPVYLMNSPLSLSTVSDQIMLENIICMCKI